MRFFPVKKIDKLLLRSFAITFILLLVLVLFILIIHTFFLVFQDAAGKGLGANVYAKLIWYIGLNIFPSAFPLAILMSALLVFGHFAESYELIAMRASGLSLQRTLRLPFIFVLMVSAALFYFQDYIHPTTKHKMFALWEDISRKKSALLIQPGVICNDIPGYSIHIDKKQKDKEQMKGIIMYDYTKKQGKVVLTTAENGKLYTTPDENYLIMELTNGHNYIEPLPAKEDNTDKTPLHPFYRNKFVHQKIRISLEALKLSNIKEQYEWDPRTRIRPQLQQLIQESGQQASEIKNSEQATLHEQCAHYQTKIPVEPSPSLPSLETITAMDAFMTFRNQLIARQNSLNPPPTTQFDKATVREVVWNALYAIERIRTKLEKQRQLTYAYMERFHSALYEKHYRLAITIRCIIMFLLAAPLGCIIRRGGFGISVIISCFFMLVEYIFSICGRDLALANKVSAFIGAWLANFTLLPFCIFFLLQAQQGIGLLSVDKYIFYVQNIKKYIKSGYVYIKKKSS